MVVSMKRSFYGQILLASFKRYIDLKLLQVFTYDAANKLKGRISMIPIDFIVFLSDYISLKQWNNGMYEVLDRVKTLSS